MREVRRRDVLRMSAGCGAVAICAGACSANEVSGQPSSSTPQGSGNWPPSRPLAAASAVPPDAPLDVTDTAGSPVFLIRTGNSIQALSGVCTHAGCIVTWQQDLRDFVCPCHRGTYTLRGTVVKGPPPRPLNQLPLQIRNGNV
jgi:Rieske Fe-S protein